MREYRQTEHGIAAIQEYETSAAREASRQTYATAEHGIATRQEYETSAAREAAIQNYETSEHGIATRQEYETSALGIATRQEYATMQLGKQRVFRLILKTIVRAIMPYLDPEDVAKHFDRRAAERAIARANSDRFRRGMVLGDGIIATILMNQPDLKGLLPTEPPCVYEDSDAANWLEPAKTWLQARAEDGSLYHATNVAPENLLCVDGTPYLLRPYDHYERGRPAYAGVWATCYSAGKALGFVQAHKHKSFVTNARDKGEDLFIYILSRDHPDYGNFHQLFVRYGIPSGGCGFFAKCRSVVQVARGTPGLTVLRIHWPNGPAADPVAVVAYGDVPAPHDDSL